MSRITEIENYQDKIAEFIEYIEQGDPNQYGLSDFYVKISSISSTLLSINEFIEQNKQNEFIEKLNAILLSSINIESDRTYFNSIIYGLSSELSDSEFFNELFDGIDETNISTLYASREEVIEYADSIDLDMTDLLETYELNQDDNTYGKKQSSLKTRDSKKEIDEKYFNIALNEYKNGYAEGLSNRFKLQELENDTTTKFNLAAELLNDAIENGEHYAYDEPCPYLTDINKFYSAAVNLKKGVINNIPSMTREDNLNNMFDVFYRYGAIDGLCGTLVTSDVFRLLLAISKLEDQGTLFHKTNKKYITALKDAKINIQLNQNIDNMKEFRSAVRDDSTPEPDSSQTQSPSWGDNATVLGLGLAAGVGGVELLNEVNAITKTAETLVSNGDALQPFYINYFNGNPNGYIPGNITIEKALSEHLYNVIRHQVQNRTVTTIAPGEHVSFSNRVMNDGSILRYSCKGVKISFGNLREAIRYMRYVRCNPIGGSFGDCMAEIQSSITSVVQRNPLGMWAICSTTYGLMKLGFTASKAFALASTIVTGIAVLLILVAIIAVAIYVFSGPEKRASATKKLCTSLILDNNAYMLNVNNYIMTCFETIDESVEYIYKLHRQLHIEEPDPGPGEPVRVRYFFDNNKAEQIGEATTLVSTKFSEIGDAAAQFEDPWHFGGKVYSQHYWNVYPRGESKLIGNTKDNPSSTVTQNIDLVIQYASIVDDEDSDD